MKDEVRDWFYFKWANFCIWLIKVSFRYKDQGLSWKLHSLADKYDRRPTGEWG
jgi:hypothetical protein